MSSINNNFLLIVKIFEAQQQISKQKVLAPDFQGEWRASLITLIMHYFNHYLNDFLIIKFDISLFWYDNQL